MLQDLELQTITLTQSASKAVSDIMTERNLEGYALRVYLSSGGCCSGVSFGMALDNNIREVDKVFDAGGVRLVVDEVSLDYLRGAKIDFVNDPERGAGFLVDSPVAREMSESHAHGEEGCACGGSCSCNN
ncbi:MAG: HesB/IscA family protein [Anaerolineae bacterium]